MRAKITFKRIAGEYIVTVNGVQHKFDEYQDAWAFIHKMRKEVA